MTTQHPTMKAVVLGSSGQIGSALMEYLIQQGDTVIPYDIMREPREDLRKQRPELETIIRDADFVYFLAFDVGGSVYLAQYQDTFQFIHNNIRIMAETFELLDRTKVQFIFASSQMANMSFSNYGILKSVGERYTKALNGLVVKFWNVYGIEHDPSKTHVITDFINMARENRCITMRTTGEEERQFLYSLDCAAAIRTLASHYNDISRDAELHVTNGRWTTIREIAEIVAELYPGTEIVPGTKKDAVQAGTKNEPDPYIFTMWQPRTPLQEGIAKVAESLASMHP